MPFLNYFLVACLAVWLLLTILNQLLLLAGFAKVRAYPRLNWDPMAVVPRWVFWAKPHPREWQLLYRDKRADGSLTPWKTAWTMPPSPLRWICNPDIRRWKAIADYCFSLLSLAAKDRKQRNELFVSIGYVGIAVYISGMQPSTPGELRQFMIAQVCGYDDGKAAEILFVSPLFRVGDRL